MNNFNIQLFAETPLNSTTTMTPEMKTFYEKRLIDQRVPQVRQPAQGFHSADRGRDPGRSGPERDHHYQRSAPVWRLDPAD